MTHKDFAGWHMQKMALDQLKAVQYFREREVWWAAIGHNIGSEEDGKGNKFARPLLVLRKFNQEFFYGLPLSTTTKTGKYYYSLHLDAIENKVLLSHLRDYDARRLLDKIGIVSEEDYRVIKRRVARIITQ